MKAIQIVVDEKLLARLDRAAKRRKLSRSAFIRESVEAALGNERLRGLIEKERAAYLRVPASPDERAALEALSEAQERVLADLSAEERW